MKSLRIKNCFLCYDEENAVAGIFDKNGCFLKQTTLTKWKSEVSKSNNNVDENGIMYLPDYLRDGYTATKPDIVHKIKEFISLNEFPNNTGFINKNQSPFGAWLGYTSGDVWVNHNSKIKLNERYEIVCNEVESGNLSYTITEFIKDKHSNMLFIVTACVWEARSEDDEEYFEFNIELCDYDIEIHTSISSRIWIKEKVKQDA